MWRTALSFYKKAIKRPSVLKKQFEVQFTSATGEGNSCDAGAIRIEFFELLFKEFQNRSLEGEVPLMVPRRSDSITYLILGMAIGHSVLHGGPGFHCFQPWVYDLIVGMDFDQIINQINIEDIPRHAGSTGLLDFVNALDNATSQKELDEIVDKYILILNFSRWDQSVAVTTANRHSLISELLMDELIRKRQSQIKSIQEGLDLTGFLAFIKANVSRCRQIFVYSKNNGLTPMEFLQLVKTDNNDDYEKKQAFDFFSKIITDSSEKYISAVLKFITGHSLVPPWGITVKYLDDDDAHIYPKTMSCFNILYLPTVHTTQQKFGEHFEKAIAIEGVGFSDNK